ncbi:MAG TPA: adenylosuccinate lyase [Gemmatimonadaceae bacterium]|nr:adenylosuccinate lyase [Gemmatimonadaceae bacterium]
MTDPTRFASPLSERYASRAMLELWSSQRRHSQWRRLWLALAEAERELGVAEVTEEGLAQMRAHLDDIDFPAAAAFERRFRHDVVAHIETFAQAAPAARPFIHYGATSAFVTDNSDVILMREGLELLRRKILGVLRSLSAFARTWRNEPALAYTHLQPAQLTTVGKRATLWMQDLLLDLGDIDYRVATLPLRGVKGTTGTQASFLEIFHGDHGKVRRLEELVVAKMGFSRALPVTGQTYSRKVDAQVLGVVAGVAASGGKFSGDVRILQSYGELEEPFEQEQVGSSAMAYKRNPMRAERIAGLARFVISLEENANNTHAAQYLERTLDDSANRRLVIPDMFLATDAILVLMENISSGLEVHPDRIRKRIAAELPFMATERLIVGAVKKGGSRQEAHATIRRHGLAAAAAMKDGAERNDLFERLAVDGGLGLTLEEMHAAAQAKDFIGRAPRQVEEFLDGVVEPLLARSPNQPTEAEAPRV